VNREHVVPKWLIKLLASEEEPEGRSLFAADLSASSSELRVTQSRPRARTLDIVVKAVCKSCNEGWMEKGQGPVRTLVDGSTEALSAIDQELVAHWAVKTGMTLDKNGTPWVSSVHQRSFYENQVPPLGWMVHLGKNPSRVVSSEARVRAASLGLSAIDKRTLKRHFFYQAHLGLGDLALLVVGHDLQVPVPLPAHDGIVQLWPPQSAIAVVPDPVSLEELDRMRTEQLDCYLGVGVRGYRTARARLQGGR
jgi:hypothetical protein